MARAPSGTAKRMTLYSALPVRRLLQVAGDVVVVLWIVLWALLGHAVHDATLHLAEPGRQAVSASSTLGERLHAAGDAVRHLPLVGGAAAGPLDEAGAAADQLGAAGRAEVRAVERLARWTGWTVALMPILAALLLHLPPRFRFVRRARAAQHLLRSSADADLFALRALAHQPLERLARVADDPAAAWRARDIAVTERLADLELRDLGVRRGGQVRTDGR